MLAMTPQQTADELQVSLATVYRWIKSGRIRTLNGDGVIRVPISQFLTATQQEEAIRKIIMEVNK